MVPSNRIKEKTMKNGFYELLERLIQVFAVVVVYAWLMSMQILLFVFERFAWFFCQLQAESQLARDDSGQFDEQQPRCKSGRHERYSSQR